MRRHTERRTKRKRTMTTNYVNTFIEIADDCPAESAEAPPSTRERQTVAALQYELLADHPYELTSDDVIFEVYARRQDIADEDKPAERDAFFAKDQACLRSSPLGKRYGWGIHHDDAGRVALVAMESDQYKALANDDSLKRVKAMRSRRA